jgi:sec-independent protein translocase protein TatA
MRPPGLWEIILILVIIFIIFGAGKLPQVFEMFGKGFRSLSGQKKTEEDAEEKAKTTKKNKTTGS